MTVTSTADLSRLATLPPLAHGAHKRDENVACIMEAVAFIAGERWSDHPVCACPVISEFLRLWNDALPDSERDALLRPLVALMVGTRSTEAVERRRATMATDWLIREYAPAWLRSAGLAVQADALMVLPEITDLAQYLPLMPVLNAVRNDALAARAAAGVAAENDAWVHAGNATRATAGDAARAAAGSIAGAAAGDAAWVAAQAVAKGALMVITASLQQSALVLVHRMIGAAA